MAKFEMVLPTEVMKDFEKIYGSTYEIFGKMTDAGADVVLSNLHTNVPASFKGSKIMGCLKKTRVYRTPSDDGVNTKVGFYGYFENHLGRIVPAPLVAKVFEYGSSRVDKRPFLRKSFNAEAIEEAMLRAQKEASDGLLDE